MKYILLLLLFTQFVFAEITLDERRKQILKIVDLELSEVTRLARSVNKKDPSLLLRMAELNLEKARLWKEKENEVFLAIPAKKRSRLKKSKFFKRSDKYFSRARSSCKEILKRFKRFKGRSDVYYILAYDAKEYNKMKLATKYFNLANKTSKGKSITKTKSQVALAEIYFNQKKFKKAIPLYEKSLKNHVDKWWTKDAFNLAWSYFKTRRHSKAISYMKNIYAKSGSKDFIDMKNYVLRDIGLFFADAGKTKEAISYYRDKGENFTKYMIKVSDYLSKKGNSTQAAKVLEEAIKYESDSELKIQATMALLEIYGKYSFYAKHLKLAKSLYATRNQLDEDQKERVIYHVEKNAALLQKKVVDKTFKRVPKTRRKYANWTISYFELLAQLRPKDTHKTFHYIGETNYTMGRYENALNSYMKAFDLATAKNDYKIQNLAMEGMLASLGQRSFPRKRKNKYYITVYNKYLSFDSKSKRAKDIYQKLFNIHYDNKDMKNVEGTLLSFQKSFPRNWTTQEAMIAKIMEFYRKKKNDSMLKNWIKRIQGGEFKVSQKYNNKLKVLLTNIQMKDVERMRSSGKKADALRNYIAIYNNKESTPETKKNSAYNLTILYYELEDIENSFVWANRALDLMKRHEVKKFNATFLTLTSFYFEKLDFGKSIDLSERLFSDMCKVNLKDKQKYYMNAALLYISTGNDKEVEKLLKRGPKCGIVPSVIDNIRKSYITLLVDKKLWKDANSQVFILAKNKKYRGQVLDSLIDISKGFENAGLSSRAKEVDRKIKNYFWSAKKMNLPVSNKVRDYIAIDEYESTAKRLINSIENIKLKFPEKTFNNLLVQKVKKLDNFKRFVDKINKIGSGKIFLKSHIDLSRQYRDFAKEIKEFIPPGKSRQYIKTFQKQMLGPAKQIESQGILFVRNAIKEIKKYEILNTDNYRFFNKDINFAFKSAGKNKYLYMEKRGTRR